MPKYKEYVQKMIDENKEVFEEFRLLHDKYSQDQDNMQAEFNQKGAKITDLIRDYENKLCANTERGAYIKFSSGLSEKFHEELRKVFPMIDHIGLIVQKETHAAQGSGFDVKKIKLF